MSSDTWKPLMGMISSRHGALVALQGDTDFIRETKKALDDINACSLGQRLFYALGVSYGNPSDMKVPMEGELSRGAVVEIKPGSPPATEQTKSVLERAQVQFSWEYVRSKHHVGRYEYGRPLAEFMEPTAELVLKRKAEYVYLFHELVHCLHVLDGSYDGVPVKGSSAKEELRTVGLYEFAAEEFSENALRREIGVVARPVYYWGTSRVWGGAEEDARRESKGLPRIPNLAPYELGKFGHLGQEEAEPKGRPTALSSPATQGGAASSGAGNRRGGGSARRR